MGSALFCVIMQRTVIRVISARSLGKSYLPRDNIGVVVVVVVVSVVGPFSTAAMRAYCTLTPPPQMQFRHSSPEALHTKRLERPLLRRTELRPRNLARNP
jgi:hypothetical protein